MKMTADQLLKIAGITPTTTLRARLTESTNSSITEVEYFWQLLYRGVDAKASHPDGTTSYIAHKGRFEDALTHGDVSVDYMTRSDWNNIQAVLDFLIEFPHGVDEGPKEYSGFKGLAFKKAKEVHNRLFGSDVKATFDFGYERKPKVR